MKISEALKLRIPRIRKNIWGNSQAYLRLPLLENDLVGPWAELYDDAIQANVLDIIPGSQKLCIFFPEVANDDGYEEYTGKVSSYELENYAKIYTES